MNISRLMLTGALITVVGVAGFAGFVGYVLSLSPNTQGAVAQGRPALIPDLPHMTDLVGHSQRLADVLSYQWTLNSRTDVTKADMVLVNAAKNELEKDDADIRLNALLSNAGMPRASIKEGDGYYEIFGRLKLSFSTDSAFEDGIDDAALLLPGELLRVPGCAKSMKPVIFQSEAFPIKSKEVGLGLKFEPPIGYRVTAKSLTPEVMQHRMVVKSLCLPDDVADKLD